MKKGFSALCMMSILLLTLSGCGGGGGNDGGELLPGTPDSAIVDNGAGSAPDSGPGTGIAPAPGASPAPDAGTAQGSETTPDSGTGSAPSPGTAPDSSVAGAAIGVGTGIGSAAWSGQAPARSRKVTISAPGTLSQADTEYVLTQDVVASGTAFTIAASNVTLNLNGRTVTYANGSVSGPCYGVAVTAYNLRGIAIVNGTIKQGSAASATNDSHQARHAIYFQPSVQGFEIAGVKFEYRTPETSAIHTAWGKEGKIHHNDFNDAGDRIINRHQLNSTIKANRAPNMEINHNRIVRTRQGGIDIGNNARVHNNAIHIDSRSTNSYGISAFEVDGFTFYNNTITGVGEHPIGIGMVAKSKNGKVYGNRIEVQNTRSGGEYGSTGSAGMRMTWGTDKVEVWNNQITVRAQANLLGPGLDSWGRGLWVGLPDAVASVIFRDNTIYALNNDGRGKAAGIAVVCLNQSPGLVFRNNLVVSNWGNVVLADDYGHADGFARFTGNVFRKEGNYDSYRTIKSDWKEYVSTGRFIGNTFENGASHLSVEGQFNSTKLKEMAFGWNYTLTVLNGGAPVAGATVRIFDNSGAEVYTGTTGANGKISAELTEYLATNRSSYSVAGMLKKDVFGVYGNKLIKNPHTVKVESGGRSASQTFSISSATQMDLSL